MGEAKRRQAVSLQQQQMEFAQRQIEAAVQIAHDQITEDYDHDKVEEALSIISGTGKKWSSPDFAIFAANMISAGTYQIKDNSDRMIYMRAIGVIAQQMIAARIEQAVADAAASPES